MILFISFIVGCKTPETSNVCEPTNFIPNFYYPKDRIKTEDITFGDTELNIKIEDPLYFYSDGSKSMIPVYKSGHHQVGIKPKRESDVTRGDIVVFNFEERQISHRVIDIKIDNEGLYF